MNKQEQIIEKLKDELSNIELRLKDKAVTHPDFKWLFKEQCRIKSELASLELQSSQTGEECYKKVFINSEEDLPKERGYYFVHLKKNYEHYPTHPFDVNYFGNDGDKTYIKHWLNSVDWYLQPISESLPESQSPSEDKIMSAETFLRKKYCVPSNKTLSEELELPHFLWSDICELLEDFASQFSQSQRKVVTDMEIEREALKRQNKLVTDGGLEPSEITSRIIGFVMGAKYLRDLLSK